MGSVFFIHTLRVVKSKSSEVREWLENLYCSEMFATNCFQEIRISVLDETDKKSDKVTYIHHFRDEASEKQYDKEHRSRIEAALMKKFEGLKAAGEAEIIQLRGDGLATQYIGVSSAN